MLYDNVFLAFQEVFALRNLLLMSIGVFLGLIAGAIPGFSITMAIVLTLPFTFGMTPIEGLSTMMGVFVGGLSGGLMSAMLLGIPGTPSSVATTFDGFPMARGGRPGLALGLGVWSSFFGGILGGVVLILIASVLGRVGLEFGPWGYFSLILFALTITASLAGEQLVKGLISGALGLLAVAIGEEEINGIPRLTFGIGALEQGLAFLPILIGLFAFSQLMHDIRDPVAARRALMEKGAKAVRVEHLAAVRMIAERWVNLVRSALIGVAIGILPAAGGSIANILAYDQARKSSRDPNAFGTGTPDGIIAPEASNNATAGGSLTILMALGIPGDTVAAVMLGALMIHDIVPGPGFIRDQPVLSYGIFVAFILAHFVMLALQVSALRVFILATRVPMYVLAAVILSYCSIGVFSLNNIVFDIWTMLAFGVIGYGMRVLGFPLVPMILGVVLGSIAELNLNRALSISGDLTRFLTNAWSLFFLILALFSAIFPWYQAARNRGRAWWPRFYAPLLCISLVLPLLMMPGNSRPVAGVALGLWGVWLLWKGLRAGPPRAESTGG